MNYMLRALDILILCSMYFILRSWLDLVEPFLWICSQIYILFDIQNINSTSYIHIIILLSTISLDTQNASLHKANIRRRTIRRPHRIGFPPLLRV